MERRRFFEHCFGLSPSLLPETVIITPVFPIKRFAESCQEVKTFRGRIYRGIKAVKNGKEFAVIYSGIGSALAGDAVLALENASVGRIIFAGLCGGLSSCGIGDIIVGEGAFNGEGFTRYHGERFNMAEIFANGEVVGANSGYTAVLKEFFNRHLDDKNILKSGNLFTIGSLIAEERKNVIDIEKKGYIGIEMELSSVYSAANKTRQKASAVMLVSDLPLKKPIGESLSAEERKRYNSGFDKIISLLTEFATK